MDGEHAGTRVRRRTAAAAAPSASGWAATADAVHEQPPQAQRRKTEHSKAVAPSSVDQSTAAAAAPSPCDRSVAPIVPAAAASSTPAPSACASSSTLEELESASELAVAAHIDAHTRDFGPHIDEDGFYRAFDVSDPLWHAHFRAAGFVVLRDIGAVPQDECWAQLWDYLEQYCHRLNRNDMTTWDSAYFSVPDSNGKSSTLRSWPKGGKAQGFINVFHLPFMWQHRQSPSVVRAFHELWCSLSPQYASGHAASGSSDAAAASSGAAAAPSSAGDPSGSGSVDPGSGLFCSIDRLGVMPPKRVFGTNTLFLHWDQCAKTSPNFQGLQGALNLRDNVPSTVRQQSQSDQLSSCVGSSPDESGGFWCVPSSHLYFPSFGERFPQQCNGQFSNAPSKPQHWLYRHLHKITMRAGSLVIWDSRLAHGNYPNRSADRTRLVQYLTYAPATWREPTLLQIRREAIRSASQYSHRRALLISFSAVTHGLGTSQDVTKRRKKLEQLSLLAERAPEEDTLMQWLESELLLIGNADGEALMPKAAFDSASSFSNRRDYYAPRKRVALQGASSNSSGTEPSQEAAASIVVPFFDTIPLLTPLGKHIAGLQQLASFSDSFRRF